MSTSVALTPVPGDDTFTIVSTSDSGNKYLITRANTGATSQTCTGSGCKW